MKDLGLDKPSDEERKVVFKNTTTGVDIIFEPYPKTQKVIRADRDELEIPEWDCVIPKLIYNWLFRGVLPDDKR